MKLKKLRPLLPEGTEIFGVQSGAKYIVRVDPNRCGNAKRLVTLLDEHAIEAVVIVAHKEDLDIYRISKASK